jgi:acetyl-CoA carboxylase/biotin carboxylase 1
VAHPNNSDDFNETSLDSNSSKAAGIDITKHARSSSFNSTVGTSNIPLEFHMNVNRLAENASDDSITYAESANNRLCYMCCYKSFSDLQMGFFALIQKLYDLREYNMPPFMVSSPIPNFYFDQNHNSPETEKNLVLYLIVRMVETEDSNEDDDSRILQDFLKQNVHELKEHQIRRVTFMIPREKKMPSYFTYRARDFYEDKIYRHLEPGLAYQLELSRMRNFQITRQNTTNRKMQLYLGTTKKHAKVDSIDRRFFLRAIIRHSNLTDKRTSLNYLTAEGERMLLEAIDELDLAMQSGTVKTDCNHIFLNFVPTVVMNKIKLVSHIRELVLRYGIRLWKMRITQAELKVNLKEELDSEPITLRIVMSSENGYALDCDCYQEVFDHNDSIVKFKAVDLGGEFRKNHRTSLDGMPINTAYPTRDLLQAKRYEAQSMGSSYVYDIVDLCRTGVWELWENYKEVNKMDSKLLPNKENVLTAEEFVLENDQLKKINRHVAQNKIGMVAWLIKILTPDSPKGREFFLVANDITYIQGSFGPKEDILYMRVSEEARKMGIPRIYFAANAGARIGLVKDLQACYKVAWVDETNVNRGYDYFYLTPEDYQKYRNFVIAEHIEVRKNKNNGVLKEEDNENAENKSADSNNLTMTDENSSNQSDLKSKTPKTTENSESDPISENSENSETINEQRYKILAIKGEDNQFGIKALSWSGAIAGETSRAYDECLTINVVSCRSVGIGAYIVRLGQRTIQVDSSCIILTGNKALNKVLGREVYTSNTQLGGKQIMHNNGVTHSIARSDEDAMMTAIKWMSFSPAKIDKFSFNCVSGIIDPIDREVTWTPQKGIPYNPSYLFTGEGDKTGLFDSNSYHEIMDGWAKTVQVGRGRIGGISVGCIVPETRSVSTEIPADPANPETDRRTTRQAGQVWFPDSAHKTAQAIRDFNREQIPLLIIGNWRGFSGGMKDMFDEILKFGALIVDELRKYKFPVIVYIPPFGELRGGAWAVLDPKINPEFMEMYCSESGRGGILEPEGIVEIKYRQKDQHLTLNRLGLGAHKEVKSLMHQMANEFVDLHDKPEALKANDVIKSVVPWSDSRKFMFFRFKRLLLQNQLRMKAIRGTHKSSKSNHHDSQLESGFFNAILQRKCENSDVNWKNDEKVVVFLEKNDTDIVEEFLTETVMIQKTREITDFLLSSDTAGNALLESLKEIKGSLPVELRTQLVDLLKVDVAKTVPEVNLLRRQASASISGHRSRKQSTRDSSTNQMTVVGNIVIGDTCERINHMERTTPLSNFSQTGSPIDIIYRKSQPGTPRNTVNSNRVPHLKKPMDKKQDSKTEDFRTADIKKDASNLDAANPDGTKNDATIINTPESANSENKHFFANTSPSLTKRPSNLTLCSTSSQDNEANN